MKVGQTGNNSVQNAESSSARKTARGEHAVHIKRSEKAGEGARSSGAADSANAEISSRAKEFARAKDVATDAPDVREDKIAELKARIAAGKYNVDSHAVADRMVDEHLSMAGMGEA